MEGRLVIFFYWKGPTTPKREKKTTDCAPSMLYVDRLDICHCLLATESRLHHLRRVMAPPSVSLSVCFGLEASREGGRRWGDKTAVFCVYCSVFGNRLSRGIRSV